MQRRAGNMFARIYRVEMDVMPFMRHKGETEMGEEARRLFISTANGCLVMMSSAVGLVCFCRILIKSGDSILRIGGQVTTSNEAVSLWTGYAFFISVIIRFHGCCPSVASLAMFFLLYTLIFFLETYADDIYIYAIVSTVNGCSMRRTITDGTISRVSFLMHEASAMKTHKYHK